MDFSEVYKQSKLICEFSPDGNHLATAVQNKLVIRNAETLEIKSVFSCSGSIDQINWSPNGELILSSLFDLEKVEIWSISDPNWKVVIHESVLGLSSAFFAPSSDYILSFSDAQLRITIWSLKSNEAAYILDPKYSNKGLAYRPDKKYVSVLERKEKKDYIGIYDTDTWLLKKHFLLDTIDAADISWSPDGQFIAVLESCIEYKVILYSPAGFSVGSYSAYEVGLGIKTMCWSPTSEHLILGSYDQKVRFLNSYTWQPTLTYSHGTTLTSNVQVHQELDNRTWRRPVFDPKRNTILANPEKEAKYKIAGSPYHIQVLKNEVDKPNPKMGVGLCELNSEGHLFLSRNDNMSRCLWIWEVGVMDPIAFACQLAPIRAARWNPVDPEQLAFVCGTNCIYLWTKSCGFECIELPSAHFNAQSLHWNSNGLSLVIFSKENFCIGFTTLAEEMPLQEASLNQDD
ncbi:hypothetical protein DSO57_1009188 [Entomophthora muscae]|uniref:Uncharacterized protein n=1 Tax=Entomophthora muscae TaxID=34485 RepID=A0ACC2U5B4_9FUNG|nr:hypothetical protein DSO57_1009188 [Entomophthora muscae]